VSAVVPQAPRFPPMPRVVLIHGTATTAGIWDPVLVLLAALPTYEVEAVERPRTGDLDLEVQALAPLVAGAWVVGMSGGATLGLALAMSGTPLAGAVLHEPAAGRLVPDLLTPAADAFARSGTDGLGRALYGPNWNPTMAGSVTDDVTAAELAMFRSFEPGPLPTTCGQVVITHGAISPAIRRRAAKALQRVTDCEVRELADSGHLAAHDNPGGLANLVRSLADQR